MAMAGATSVHAPAQHGHGCTPEVDEVASARPFISMVVVPRENFEVRDAAWLLRQAASGIEQPLAPERIKIHSHMARAQDGQQGFAAQRQVSLHAKAFQSARPRDHRPHCCGGTGKAPTLSSPHKWLTIISTTPSGRAVSVALPRRQSVGLRTILMTTPRCHTLKRQES